MSLTASMPDGDPDLTSPGGGFVPFPSGATPTREPESAGRTPFAATDPYLGKVLDHRYRLLELVAKGGMGRIYRAEQAPLGRTVVVKVLDSSGEQDQEFRDRFIREAAACARLTHPNTIRIYDYGCTWDDVHYIAMEHLVGRNLHAVIRAEAPMAVERVVHIGRQICAALREAHGLGLIHRDLKPSNVMLVPNGDEAELVKVLDFGLVKELRSQDELTRADAVVGSPSYMSPEQIRAGPIDARSDIYSLGVLLYACLTGRTPFPGENTVNVLMAHLSQEPPKLREANPATPAGPLLEWIVLTCLAKEPDARFADVDAVRRALARAGEEARGAPATTPALVDGHLATEDTTPPGTPSMIGRPPVAPDPARTGAGAATSAEPPTVPEPVPPSVSSPSGTYRGPGASSPSGARPFQVRQAVPWALGIVFLGLTAALVGVMAAWWTTRGIREEQAAAAAITGAAPAGEAGALADAAEPGADAAGNATGPGATAAAPAAGATNGSAGGSASGAATGASSPPTGSRSGTGAARGSTTRSSRSAEREPSGTASPPEEATPAAAPSPAPAAPAPAAPAPATKAAPTTSPAPTTDLRDPWKDR